MEKQTQHIVVGVALFGLFLIFGATFFNNSAPVLDIPLDTDDETNVDMPEDVIVASRTFTNGTHIYAGIVMLPTPCHASLADVTVAESFPEQVTIALTTIAPPPDQICAQVLTPQLFSVEFNASKEATIRVFRDGEIVSVALVEELPPLQ